jgi:hypothetical protein
MCGGVRTLQGQSVPELCIGLPPVFRRYLKAGANSSLTALNFFKGPDGCFASTKKIKANGKPAFYVLVGN